MADDRAARPDAIATELNRYFTGKYMAARDFGCDQHYFRNRQATQFRLIGGWGVIQGLGVEPSPDQDCPDWLIVRAGIAVAPSGRLLVLPEDRSVELPAGGETVLALRGRDEGIEPAPLLVGNATGDPDTREMNRIREQAELVTLPPGRLPPGGWAGPPDPPAPGAQETPASLVSIAPTLGVEAGVIADGADEDVVPIARITPGADTETGGTRRIVTAGRRHLQRTGGNRIMAHNWPHGGTLSFEQLSRWRDRLVIVFSGPLLADPGPGLGIGPMTFRASYRDAQGRHRDLAALNEADDWYVRDLADALDPKLLREAGFPAGDLFAAVFHLNPNQLAQLEGHTLEISLRCDFVPDANGRPVDGCYLGARLPTGNGLPGGQFDSWFTLAPTQKRDDSKETERPTPADREAQHERG